MTDRKAAKAGRFKKGDPRINKAGAKSKDACELTRLMRNAMTDAGLKDERFSQLADLIWERACRGVPFYVEKALEYSIGKPVQPVENTGTMRFTIGYKKKEIMP